MIGRIKAVGLAFVAVVALSAVAASAVEASQFHISQQTGVPVAPSVITGHSDTVPGEPTKFQEHILTLQNTAKTFQGNSKCHTASFEGTLTTATPDEATVTPTYGTGKGVESEVQGCLLFGFKAQVLMNGCKYTLTGTHTPVGGQPQTNALTAWVDIVGCTAGKQIEIRAPLAACTLKIGEQNTLSHIVFTNLATAPKTVTANATVSGITVQQVGAGCPDGNLHHGTNASFTGNTIIKAFQDNGTEQKTLHQHQYTAHKCGTQIDIQAT